MTEIKTTEEKQYDTSTKIKLVLILITIIAIVLIYQLQEPTYREFTITDPQISTNPPYFLHYQGTNYPFLYHYRSAEINGYRTGTCAFVLNEKTNIIQNIYKQPENKIGYIIYYNFDRQKLTL